MHLERLAVAVLWVDDGHSESLHEYEPKMTLGVAYKEIHRRDLLDDTTTTTLKAVAALRNSVAHRDAIFVTAPSPIEGQTTGEYKGHQVFMDREALDELTRDVDAAAQAMYDWIAAKAPRLVAEPRDEQGAHGPPTPP